jgi:hypothetical protein
LWQSGTCVIVLRIAHSLTARAAFLAENSQAVNATKTLFLTSVAAVIALANVAHAQIAFRSSSSAFVSGGGPAIPTLRAAAAGGPPITIVGDSSWVPASDNSFTTATSATIVPPPGMQNKDVVLVFVNARVSLSSSITSGAAGSAAAGGQTWWPVSSLGSTTPQHRVFRTIFNGTWTANPQFSFGSTAVTYQMRMIVLRGADVVSQSATQPQQEGNCCPAGSENPTAAYTAPASPFDVTIPSATMKTTTDNAMVFAVWTSADNNTWALQSGGWSQPGGQPQWRTMAAAGDAGADTSMSIAYLTQATAGPVPALTNRQMSLGGDGGQYQILAVRPAGIRKPPGTVAGDVMIATLVFSNASAVTPPAGWTLVRRINDSAKTPGFAIEIYRRVADASDDSVSGYVWVSNTNGWVGGIQSFSGVDTANPIDVENGQATASSLNHATPSVTTTGPNRLIVTSHMVGMGSVTGWTPPAGMTETLDFRHGKNINGGTVETSNVLQATAGATGTKTATIDGSTARVGAILLSYDDHFDAISRVGSVLLAESETRAD